MQIWRTLLECNLQLEQSADTPETPATDGAIPTPPHPAAPPTPSAAADSLPQLSASGTVLATITTRAIQAFTVEFNRAYNMNVTLSPVAYSAFNEQQLSEFPTRERPGSADFWFVGAEVSWVCMHACVHACTAASRFCALVLCTSCIAAREPAGEIGTFIAANSSYWEPVLSLLRARRRSVGHACRRGTSVIQQKTLSETPMQPFTLRAAAYNAVCVPHVPH